MASKRSVEAQGAIDSMRETFALLDRDPIRLMRENVVSTARRGAAKTAGEPLSDTTVLAGLHKARLMVSAKVYGITGAQAKASRAFLRQHGFEIPPRP